MEYRNNNNKLIIKQETENNNGAYWITINFEEENKKYMQMQIFVKSGEIINKSITLKENTNRIQISSHNHDNQESFDESFITINYKDYFSIKEKSDSIILDNIKINNEEEAIIITELLKNNGITVDTDSLFKLFQKSLSEYKKLSSDNIDSEKEYLEISKDVDKTLKPIRLDIVRQNLLDSHKHKINR